MARYNPGDHFIVTDAKGERIEFIFLKEYIVKKGDTLYSVAQTVWGEEYRLDADKNWTILALANAIEEPYELARGKSLIIPELNKQSEDTAKKETPNYYQSSKSPYVPTVTYFGLAADDDVGTDSRDMVAVWKCNAENLDKYKVWWEYHTAQGGKYAEESEVWKWTTTSTYSPPKEAISVHFWVKAISELQDTNNTTSYYWTADWSREREYYFSNNPPNKPELPEGTLSKDILTLKWEGLESDLTGLKVEIWIDDSSIWNTYTIPITITQHAELRITLNPGHTYKLRCAAVRNNRESSWTDYSGDYISSPETPSGFTSCRATKRNEVVLTWNQIPNATSGYEIEYTDNRLYFDVTSSTRTQQLPSDAVTWTFTSDDLSPGKEWFFRIRSLNEQGTSKWSSISSVVLGLAPSAPTTWSNTVTAVKTDTGYEEINLYWVHNPVDGSRLRWSLLTINLSSPNGMFTYERTVTNDTPEDEPDKVQVFTMNNDSEINSKIIDGTIINWSVRTVGIMDEPSPSSIQREITVYQQPGVNLRVQDREGRDITELHEFPLVISSFPYPATQIPISYQIKITSKSYYETVTSYGDPKTVRVGDVVYSKVFDYSHALYLALSANNVDFASNAEYQIECTVTMNSGLSATATSDFKVAWEEVISAPNASIGYDKDRYVTYISPFCKDDDGNRIPNVWLSVYRREFDGYYTEIATELDNTEGLYVVDPHPSLDYARYRIVVTSRETGAINYLDAPAFPILEKGVIIQWNDTWRPFDRGEAGDQLSEQPWSGSLLRLPYNIDVTENTYVESQAANYIGRKYPVSYYGTFQNTTPQWSMAIPKKDKETIYALRRLMVYHGDVYVREPSGVGYWAQVKVSFNQTHNDPVVPITLDITRVEGGT